MKQNSSDFIKSKGNYGFALFVILYILLILLPAIYLLSGKYCWVNISLAVVLAILVLFYYFDSTYETSVSWGMNAIYTSKEGERYFMEYQKTHFWKETDILVSYDIRLFLKTKIDELSVMAKLGSKMRILLLDPESKYVPMVEDACGMPHGEYAYYVLQIQSFAMRVYQSSNEKSVVDVQIKYYDGYPPDNLLCAGDVMFAYDNKQNGANNYMVYTFEKDLNGFNFYRTLFNEKWNSENETYTKEITFDMVKNYRAFAEKDTLSYTV